MVEKCEKYRVDASPFAMSTIGFVQFLQDTLLWQHGIADRMLYEYSVPIWKKLPFQGAPHEEQRRGLGFPSKQLTQIKHMYLPRVRGELSEKSTHSADSLTGERKSVPSTIGKFSYT